MYESFAVVNFKLIFQVILFVHDVESGHSPPTVIILIYLGAYAKYR